MSDKTNPFVTERQAEAIQLMLTSSFRLATVTIRTDAELTAQYAMLTGMHAGMLAGDELTGGYALLWNLADMIDDLSSSSGAEVRTPCGHVKCAEDHAQQMAFVDAATRGELDSAMNVVKVVVKDAQRAASQGDHEADASFELCKLYASTLCSLAMNLVEAAQKQHNDEHHGGKDCGEADPQHN